MLNQQPTAYEALLRGASDRANLNGAVEIMADPAVQGNPSKATTYSDRDYTKSDDIHLGIATGSAGGLAHPANTAVLFSASPSEPFKPHAFVVPSSHSWQLYIRAIKIGSFNAVDGDDIPAETHSEVSLSQFVSWPTIQTNQPIQVIMFNGAGWDKRYSLDLRGTRLRP